MQEKENHQRLIFLVFLQNFTEKYRSSKWIFSIFDCWFQLILFEVRIKISVQPIIYLANSLIFFFFLKEAGYHPQNQHTCRGAQEFSIAAAQWCLQHCFKLAFYFLKQILILSNQNCQDFQSDQQEEISSFPVWCLSQQPVVTLS